MSNLVYIGFISARVIRKIALEDILKILAAKPRNEWIFANLHPVKYMFRDTYNSRLYYAVLSQEDGILFAIKYGPDWLAACEYLDQETLFELQR